MTYGGTLTATGTLTALAGCITRNRRSTSPTSSPPCSERSAQWADLKANGTVSGPTYNVLTLTGTDPARNVFAITDRAAAERRAGHHRRAGGLDDAHQRHGVVLHERALPASSWSAAARASVLWNFPLATTCSSTSGLDWQGTMLAPNAAVSVANGQLLRLRSSPTA